MTNVLIKLKIWQGKYRMQLSVKFSVHLG